MFDFLWKETSFSLWKEDRSWNIIRTTEATQNLIEQHLGWHWLFSQNTGHTADITVKTTTKIISIPSGQFKCYDTTTTITTTTTTTTTTTKLTKNAFIAMAITTKIITTPASHSYLSIVTTVTCSLHSTTFGTQIFCPALTRAIALGWLIYGQYFYSYKTFWCYHHQLKKRRKEKKTSMLNMLI